MNAVDPSGYWPEWINGILGFFGIGPKIQIGNETINVKVDVGYRYVSEAEFQFIKQNGYIPNTDISGNPKDVYISTNKYNSVSDAESGLQIGAKNPNGATQSPKYRVKFKLNSVKYDYMGNVQGGTGIELTTKEKIFVDTKKIKLLKNNNNGSGGGGSGGHKTPPGVYYDDGGQAWKVDNKGNWSKIQKIPFGPYFLPVNPIIPSFGPVFEPVPIFGW